MSTWQSSSAHAAPAIAAPDTGSVPATRRVTLPFAQLADADTLSLRGTDATTELEFGMRLDEGVQKARLVLSYTLSPALLPQTSHVKVFLNDELLTTLPVVKERAGSPQTTEIDLDPMYFVDFNRLRFQLIGHYTDQCEFPNHSSLWAKLGGQSRLEFDLRQLPLKDNLALLPAPFFDVRDKSAVVLPVVFAPNPATDTLKAAGMVASWLGVLADYRSVRLPVSYAIPKRGNAVVFVTGESMPEGLGQPAATAPTLSVVANPNDASGKLLVVSGRNAADLQTAAAALALGQAALSGDRVAVDKLVLPARRAAYDAPAWVDTRKPVRLGQLARDPSALQVRGSSLGQIDTPMRLPPDLFIAEEHGVPVELKFRHTPPVEGLGASLSLTMNDQFVASLPLQAPGGSGLKGLLPARLLNDGTVQDSGKMVIPAFLLGGNNDMKWRFDLPATDTGKCMTVQSAGMLGAIDPDSTIDLSSLYHYTAMPNLALFANSGFPFTKYADLAETAIVLPDAAAPADIEAMLVMLARMGSMTSLAATRFEVHPAREAAKLKDRDLLVISHGDGRDALAAWNRDMPMALDTARRSFAPLNRLRDAAYAWWHDAGSRLPAESDRGAAVFAGNGPLGALMGFKSPVDGSRSVVALAASDAGGLGDLLSALNDAGRLRSIRGDLSLVRGEVVESFRVEPEYFVGTLPWWRWFGFQAGRHPVLMAIFGLLAGVLLAFAMFGVLRQLAERRLGRKRA